ncbi:hypothetical protein M9458_003171, partial [Cirrhinus mrigala]
VGSPLTGTFTEVAQRISCLSQDWKRIIRANSTESEGYDQIPSSHCQLQGSPRLSAGQRSSSCEPARSHDTAVADVEESGEVWGPRAHLVLITARQSRLFISLIDSTLA